MKNRLKLLAILVILTVISRGQPILEKYKGNWLGKWGSSRDFILKL